MILDVILDVMVGIWVALLSIAAIYTYYTRIIPAVLRWFERRRYK